MLGLADRIGNITAYLYNNLIIDKDQQVVKGIILGNCVFGVEGKMVGKLVHNILYTDKGEIAARKLVKNGQEFIVKNFADLYRQAWNITSKVKNHIAPWIEPTPDWSTLALPDILKKQ